MGFATITWLVVTFLSPLQHWGGYGECSSRTSECPPYFCLKKILGLKSICLFTQFATDLLACQFAMLNWVQLNCDLAVAYMTMWPKHWCRGLRVHFLQSCCEKPITARYEHGWAKLSALWSVNGSGWLYYNCCICREGWGMLNQCRLQEATQLSCSASVL